MDFKPSTSEHLFYPKDVKTKLTKIRVELKGINFYVEKILFVQIRAFSIVTHLGCEMCSQENKKYLFGA